MEALWLPDISYMHPAFQAEMTKAAADWFLANGYVKAAATA